MSDDADPPPHDEQAERVVLCGLLIAWPVVWREVRRAGLSREHLYIARHRLVWDAAAGLGAAGLPVTPEAVWRDLGRRGRWPEWGGYLTDRTGRRGLGCAAWLVGVLDADPTGYWALREAVRLVALAGCRGEIHAAREREREAVARARAVGRVGVLAAC